MLIRLEPAGTKFDEDVEDDGRTWVATPHARFERLLRETGIPLGLLVNSSAIRLVYAPKGETSGFATFELAHMLAVQGRPMLSALHMLLQANRFFGAPDESLTALLAESRRYQEHVSTALAEQVLAALHELLRGLSDADARVGRTRIVDLARTDNDLLYGGILTALMRLVFILYAEDRDLFPRDEVWVKHYSLVGLFERLRDDAALYPDTMDDRFGAWAQLVALWRLVHHGGSHGGLRLVPRRGRLFDPDRFPFLEGRDTTADPIDLAPVSDGVIHRILERLLVLHGDRLSYRTLDVEQIGSVYQAVMGFTIKLTTGRSLAIRVPAKGGAAVTVDFDELLAVKPQDRPKRLTELTDRKFTPKQAEPVKKANSIESLEAALDTIIDRRITPGFVPKGRPVLQPTETRRRTGSHYTPRELTEPIVAETLRPILERLGPEARPEQILDLKVLDPAVGSGAFLVEVCRQLAERLVAAWGRHGGAPQLPPDEDAVLHARRLVAQRCIYGVDRNAMASELAKLSLWLATLARDHEFTFLDHAIRHGDALVGLSRDLIGCLHWETGKSAPFVGKLVGDRIKQVEEERRRIREAVEGAGEDELRPMLTRAERALADVALVGDAVLSAFFAADKPRAREEERISVVEALESAMGASGWQDKIRPLAGRLRETEPPIFPFHWEVQFPEVFMRQNPGFDAIVGNPPYAGKNTIIAGNAPHYLDWLKAQHQGAHGNSDLIAHFFRRAFALLRRRGTSGLLATNTIRQGDTRATGLRYIRENGGTIYNARRRYKWPGEAAVVVSVIHLAKGDYTGPVMLEFRKVEKITAFLFDKGGDNDPIRLVANAAKSFQGSIVLGMGFTFDDTDKSGVASPLSHMHDLIATDSRNAERIFPYIGGEEVNSDPRHAYHRYVINFEDFALRRDHNLKPWSKATNDERRDMRRAGILPADYSGFVAADWPLLLKIVEERVRPERTKVKDEGAKKFWWRFIRPRGELQSAIAKLDRVLVCCCHSPHLTFTFLPSKMVYAHSLIVFPLSEFAEFALLQSGVHEVWARLLSSSIKDDLRYTPTSVFETFPFPPCIGGLEEIGRQYYEHRAALMVAANEGLTETYNRFHDPNPNRSGEPIVRLRELHAEMDAAVLRAYSWDDLAARAIPVFEREWEDGETQGPWRLRWSEETREEVLARLLDLNAQRAKEEATVGLTATAPRSADASELFNLIGEEAGDDA